MEHQRKTIRKRKLAPSIMIFITVGFFCGCGFEVGRMFIISVVGVPYGPY